MTKKTAAALAPGQTFALAENGLHIIWSVEPDGDFRLLHFSCLEASAEALPADRAQRYRALEIQATGENQADHHGLKHTGTSPARLLRFVRAEDSREGTERHIAFHLATPEGVAVVQHWHFYEGLPVARNWTEIVNNSTDPLALEHVSSFHLVGLTTDPDWDDSLRLHIAQNCWKNEAQWRSYRPSDLGLYGDAAAGFAMKRVYAGGLGGWSNGEYLGMGAVEDTVKGTTLCWDIEHHGSWGYEISTLAHSLYVQAYGPSFNDHHWRKTLAPGESFVSVPVAVASVCGKLDDAVRAHTGLRRKLRRPSHDHTEMPVIFNDYMNCLMGDPTTEKLLPLIDKAAESGCEVFVIDAGWYDEGPWWDGVGEWQPAKGRFPGGIDEPLNRIRERGMVPGLWLEIESMGIQCPLAPEWPDECFFLRDGHRIISNSRYHLDFRHPKVRAHADEVVDRVVREYGCGYIKMDFNINLGPGTDVDADSPGDGFLEHNRAYLDWLDATFDRHPRLIIENCGSGGLRMNTALLRRHSIQSTSDCQDYRRYASIAAACPTVAPPEQLAVWSYPLTDGDAEETAFNMVNALLLRIHQSGHLVNLSEERFALVREGITVHKEIRQDIGRGLPFWPLGIPRIGDAWTAFGLDCGERGYLAVWRNDAPEAEIEIPLGAISSGRKLQPELIYPKQLPAKIQQTAKADRLRITLPAPISARLFRLW